MTPGTLKLALAIPTQGKGYGVMPMVMRTAMIVVRWATVARPSGHGRKAFGGPSGVHAAKI